MIRIVFVCLGNICRSPTAEGVMRQLAEQSSMSARLHLDSAGTGGWHAGELPDPRTRAAAARRGIELTHRARQFTVEDFARFDLVVAMDRANMRNLHQLTRSTADVTKLSLLRRFDPRSPADAEVPDPYQGGPEGFEHVLDLCEAACRGLLEHVRNLAAPGTSHPRR
jgi:protein-tyrosine phosphatase